MKKMHSLVIVIILFGFLSPSLFSQESENTKIKELYLSGNLLTFNNFGLQYKSELKNGNFFRIGITDIYSEYADQKYGSSVQYPSKSTHFAGRFEIGLEKRTQITEKLTAFYGINFITSTSFQRNKREDPTLPHDSRYLDDFSIEPGFGFNSGFILNITGDFSIAAEIIPQLVFKYASSERISGSEKVKDTNTGGSLNLDNQSVRVSLIYKWNRK